MHQPKMDTTTVRSFRRISSDLFVEVITWYLNIYDGLGNKISSRQQKEDFRQVYSIHPIDTKGLTSNTGMEEYEMMDGTKVLLIGTGQDINGEQII